MLTLATYGPSLEGEFVHEDTREWQAWRGWAELSPASPSRRLTHWVTVARQSALGASSRAHRVTSLAVHLMNAGLLLTLARTVVPLGAAVLAMGLVLLHPLNTEAVGYAANLSELLMAACVLSALLLADRGRMWLAWLACAGAALAKEPGICAFLLVPIWVAGRRGLSGRIGLWWVASVTLPAVALWPMIASHGYGVPPLHDLARNVTAYGVLLGQWVWPTALTPMPDWYWLGRSEAALGLSLAVSAGLVLAASRTSAWVGLLIVASLAPRLLWWLPGGPREHHLYLASMALSVVGAAGLWRLTERRA